MTSLVDKISTLERRIAEFEAMLDAAPPGDKIAYVNLITASRNNLHDLFQQQLQQQQQAQAGGGQDTPKLMSSVFILMDANFSPTGTAFVISPTCVISAYHCVADDAQKPTKKHTNQWLIANGLERNHNGNVSVLSPESIIPLEVKKFVIRDDWVLLRRTDGLQFDDDQVVPVCPRDSIPKHDDEVKVKIYHCPIDLFRDGMVDVVRPCSVELQLAMTSNHRAFVQTGLFGGSSGGLYALMNGSALAMHVESVSTSKSISDIFKDNRTYSENECASEASDSCTNTHAAFASGIILRMYSNLMREL